ncbi:MAG: hypothetical protein JNL28_07210, partial [Planctomycetes bacterium]|nr:hypothetical protein [Planctomycetota bacterium]
PLNCAALTGVVGLTQGTYGSVAWVTDAACVNGLCTTKCIRYTRNAVPLPVGVTTDTFNYTITDTNGCTATCPVTVTVASPVCQPDTGNVCNTTGALATINVLANDSSLRPLNCAALTGVVGLTQGTYGSVAWVTDAACVNGLCTTKCIRYTRNAVPLPAGVTTDTFNYTITDTNGCTATCPVTVTVASPVCLPDTGDVCNTTGALTTVNVLANDSSLRPLNCAALTGVVGLTQGTYGSVAWVTDAACVNALCTTKCIRYTRNAVPLPAGVTTDTFNYTITDTNGCTATCPVTITVSSPVCAPDCADVCDAAGSMATINVLANDSSLRPLNCAALTGVVGLTQGTYGSVAWVTDAACANALCTTKCIKYTRNAVPLPGGVTQDTFNYTITDTFGCPVTCAVTVKICKVDAVNDGPVDVCQGDPVRICILDNDISTCGPLSCANITIVTQPTGGQLQITNNCANLPTACNQPLGGCAGCCVVYTPNPGFFGRDGFTYRLSVTSTACPGGTPITCTDTAMVNILVKPRPTAVDDVYELGLGGIAGPFDVRTNDSPGTGCELTGCGAPCVYVGCPEIIQQPQFGTLFIDPVTCQITYTANPAVPFPGSDMFCYRIRNNCGCCATACVTISECPTINRLLPGSLLLFPEYDNRPNMTTYVTVTNTSCKYPSFGTWVEFVYIDKNTCIETNRTSYLSACDTITVITSAHNPNPTRGYMYAFAKDSLGRPISFNHLIGDLIVQNGIDGTQYGINAVSFRSPLRQDMFTDLDNDGIRDLDGHEYDPAPDEIFIPRFLGQDPPGGLVEDDLVILGLSGGVSFQTVVNIVGYNDNEQVFSVSKQFYCWEKWKLNDISGSFLNTYLKGLGDDPLEIIGNPARETGWFRIDGATAFSDAEQIVDPAIYAFLVERYQTPDRAAELPFEFCVQYNGDLLPKNIFGDGPNPVPGDNQ